MVLPASTADAAPPAAGAAAWLDRIRRVLGLTDRGVIVLVAEAQPARLRELVLALLDLYAGLRVCVEAPALLDIPEGATVLLRLRAQDSTWLNYTRPIFSERAWRVVLWDEDGATTAIKEEAPDFFDWISHVVTCPAGVPGFAVRGLQTAPRFPGVVWRGQDFERALAEAYPDAVSTALSVRAPYAELVAAAREAPGWLVCRDMASARDLVRLRWALAETGRLARCVLVEPTVETPGWWPVSDEFASWEEILREMRCDDPAAAALVAALLEREPGTGELAGELALKDGRGEAGMSLAELATMLRGADDPGAALARLVDEYCRIKPGDVIVRLDLRAVLRGLDQGAVVEDARAQCAAKIVAELARWRPDSGRADDFPREEVLCAWAGTAPAEVPALPPERPPHWRSVYWLEATLGKEQPSPAAMAWAEELNLGDVVAHWEKAYGLGRAESEGQRPTNVAAKIVSDARAASLVSLALREDGTKRDVAQRVTGLAEVLRRRGQHREAEDMLRSILDLLEASYGVEHPEVAVVLDGLAKVLQAQGRYDEAESILRRALDITSLATSGRRDEVERGHAPDVLRDWRALASSNELGDMELAAGNLDAARAHYSTGLELATKLADMEPDDSEAQRDLLASELRLARLDVRAKQPDEARHHLDAARAVLERIDAAGSLRGDALLEKYRQSIVDIERELSA